MKLPGSGQLGMGKALLMEYPWHRFEPHPEWANWARENAPGASWGDWIWTPEGDPTRDAPVSPRFFRRTFVLPSGKPIERAVLRLTVDDRFTAYLNGKLVGSHANWMSGGEFADVGRLLRPGENVLAVRGENGPGPKDANPAGLACVLEVKLGGGETVIVRSDRSWRSSATEPAGWREPGFDDRGCEPARVIARFGEGPWGRNVGVRDEFQVPYAAGIPGTVRVVYLPRPMAVAIHQLGPNRPFTARAFDPVSGRKADLGPIHADARGDATISPPKGMPADWVLILEDGRS